MRELPITPGGAPGGTGGPTTNDGSTVTGFSGGAIGALFMTSLGAGVAVFGGAAGIAGITGAGGTMNATLRAWTT